MKDGTARAGTRTCTNCGKQRSLSEFPAVTGRNGERYYRRVCKACRKAYEATWKVQNKEHVTASKRHYYVQHRDETIERVKKWQTENREYKLAYQRAWYLANRKRVVEKQARWYEENKDVARAYREANRAQIAERMHGWREQNKDAVESYMVEWRAANTERLREYAAQYRKEKPEVKRLAEGKRRARKKQGSLPDPIPFAAVMALWEAQEGRCIYCEAALMGSYDIDHIQPLAKGGSHEVGNLQLLCPRCNRRKGAKTHSEFLVYLAKRGACRSDDTS